MSTAMPKKITITVTKTHLDQAMKVSPCAILQEMAEDYGWFDAIDDGWFDRTGCQKDWDDDEQDRLDIEFGE